MKKYTNSQLLFDLEYFLLTSNRTNSQKNQQGHRRPEQYN